MQTSETMLRFFCIVTWEDIHMTMLSGNASYKTVISQNDIYIRGCVEKGTVTKISTVGVSEWDYE